VKEFLSGRKKIKSSFEKVKKDILYHLVAGHIENMRLLDSFEKIMRSSLEQGCIIFFLAPIPSY